MYQEFTWGWELYPPPYDFASPVPSPLSSCGARKPGGWPNDGRKGGLGGCGCGGSCGGCGGGHNHGLGLFESGLDYTQWGVGEWAAVLAGGYLAWHVLQDAGRASRTVRKQYRSSRARSRRKADLERQLSEL